MRESRLPYFIERGSGPPLLLIHGLMVTGEMFEPVLDPFASRHRVIVPDLRGHGHSRALGPPYTVQETAADLSRLLDHLAVPSAAVLGYSQGGAVAQQLALDDPARVLRLVLGCTYAFNMSTVRERIEGRLVPFFINLLGIRAFANLVIAQGLKGVSREHVRLVSGLIANQDRRKMLAAWRAAMAFDSRRRLKDITCPTLIIAAANDVAVPRHHAEMLHAGIKGSELVIVDGVDHAFLWQRPDEFVRLVEEFLGDG